MNASTEARMNHFKKMIYEGRFGNDLQSHQKDFSKLTTGDALKDVVWQLYQETSEHYDIILRFRQTIAGLIIVTYRDLSRIDPTIAYLFLNAWIEDHPDHPGTALYSRWEDAIMAHSGWSNTSTDQTAALKFSLALCQSYNEFLDGLFGWLLIAWRAIKGKKVNAAVLTSPFGVKYNEFETLVEGKNGAFFNFFALANPPLRNAITHKTAWYDTATSQLRYSDGKGDKHRDYTLPIEELLANNILGGQIAYAFLSGVAFLTLMANPLGVPESDLPDIFVKAYHFVPEAADGD